MDLTDWLLFLHVLAAFAVVASVVVYGVILAAGPGRDADGPGTLALAPLGRRLWDIGGLGTLLLGVALALDIDGYKLWDAWIIIAFVLWLIAGATGTQLGMRFQAQRDGDESPSGPPTAALYGIMSVAVFALLVVMIYKPGT